MVKKLTNYKKINTFWSKDSWQKNQLKYKWCIPALNTNNAEHRNAPRPHWCRSHLYSPSVSFLFASLKHVHLITLGVFMADHVCYLCRFKSLKMLSIIVFIVWKPYHFTFTSLQILEVVSIVIVTYFLVELLLRMYALG